MCDPVCKTSILFLVLFTDFFWMFAILLSFGLLVDLFTLLHHMQTYIQKIHSKKPYIINLQLNNELDLLLEFD